MATRGCLWIPLVTRPLSEVSGFRSELVRLDEQAEELARLRERVAHLEDFLLRLSGWAESMVESQDRSPDEKD